MATDPSTAIERAIRARLVNSPAVIALVPIGHILDRHARPAPDPAIILGEDQVIDTHETIARDTVRVYSTLHVWKRELSFDGVKAITGAIRRAIGRVSRLDLGDAEFFCADCRVDSARYLRDPDGETSHAIVVLNSLVQQRWSVSV